MCITTTKRTPRHQIVVHVPEAVVDDAVQQLRVAEPHPGTRALHVVRDLGHALKPPSHYDVALAEHDCLSREKHAFHARRTHLVDGRAAHACRKAGVNGGLASRCLAHPCAHHVSEDDLFDLIWLEAGTFNCCSYSHRSQFRAFL